MWVREPILRKNALDAPALVILLFFHVYHLCTAIFWSNCALDNADRGIQPESISEAFHAFQYGKTPAAASPLSAAGLSNQTIQESMRLLLLIRAHQVPLMDVASPLCPS
jgi:hypothetical protein